MTWVLLTLAAAGGLGLAAAAWVLLVLAAVMHAWTLISPRSLWRATVAWRYTQPAAHQPSQEAYDTQRFTAAVGLLLVAVIAALVAAG